MKKNLLAITLSVVFCSGLAAQTILKPHFTEESKKIVIPKEGSVAPEIHEGLIVIHDYPRVMYVKTSGEYVFGTDFPLTIGNYKTPYFSGGAVMAYRRIKPNDNSVSAFIIYPDGKYRDFPPEKNSYGSNDIFAASSFCEGYAVVRRGNYMISTLSFIDKNGKPVFPQLTSKMKGTLGDMNIYPVRENRRVYYNAELEKYGYADAKGVIVIKPQFAKALDFSEGLAAVKTIDGKWGFIDLTGKMVIPATFKLQPGRFSEGLAAVKIGQEERDYEMTYIDKTGKRMMETKPWNLNEFHNGFAWVATGCDKLFVMDKEFKEVRDMTKDFYHNGNGYGVCDFKMTKDGDLQHIWGIDFPNGMQSLNQQGVDDGDIFAPDGTILYQCVDAKGNRVTLHNVTEGDLMFCQVRMEDQPQLKEKSVYLSCFINNKGEIVYYFEGGVEGFEGPTPVQVK